MNKKDLAYLKRRLNVEHCHITSIRGLYVNGNNEPVSAFEVLPVRTSKEDMEKYCAIFKRVLTGEDAQNLLTIDFTPEQVISGEEYGLLTELKDCAIHNDELTDAFFEKVCACLPKSEEQHHLILLMHDACDIRHHNSDGSDDEGLSDTIFHYILAAVCPVKRNKAALCYDAGENLFTSRDGEWVAGMPEMGLMFPTLEDGAPNIYNAICYTHKADGTQEAFIETMFGAQPPVPNTVQREDFQALLNETLGNECSLEVVQTIHEQVMERIEEKKADKEDPAPARIDKREVTAVLEDCGVTEERRAAFEQKFDEEFGLSGMVNAVAVSSPKQFQLKTPDVVIKVSPSRTDLVETRIIDGHPYILIRAEEGVEVNGVNVRI